MEQKVRTSTIALTNANITVLVKWSIFLSLCFKTNIKSALIDQYQPDCWYMHTYFMAGSDDFNTVN